jgi:hypothetical protein
MGLLLSEIKGGQGRWLPNRFRYDLGGLRSTGQCILFPGIGEIALIRFANTQARASALAV